jgi:adenylyl- and sulfurtransferase ThiI
MVDHLLRRIQKSAKCPFKYVPFFLSDDVSHLAIPASRHSNHEALRLELTDRFVSRVIPISATTTATIKNLQSISIPIIKSGFETPENKPLKFAVVVNTRNSHKLDRLEMIKTVAENVEALGAGHSVDLSNPDRTIIIEVNKVCHFDSLGKVADSRTPWEYQYCKITIR